MYKYHKINTVFKRNPENMRELYIGGWSCPEFDYLQDNEWIFTEKVDGTNVRVIFDGNDIDIRGKTDRANLRQDLIDSITSIFFPIIPDRLKEKFDGKSVCFYGEGYGGKIQSGGKYSKTLSFVLFDINIDGLWLDRKDVVEIAHSLSIPIVPMVSICTLNQMIEHVSHGIMSRWGDFLAEGVVGVPIVPLNNKSGKRVITKIKTADFKFKEHSNDFQK